MKASSPGTDLPALPASGLHPWGRCALRWLLAYWLVLVTWASALFISESSLHEDRLEDWMLGLLLGFFYGSLGSVIWFLIPVPVACYFLRPWPRFRKSVLVSVLLVIGLTLTVGILRRTPEKQLAAVTGIDGAFASCVAHYRTTGFDPQHLWVFKSTPEAFQKHLSALPWSRAQDIQIFENQDETRIFRLAHEAFGAEPWEPSELYRYGNFEWEESGPRLPLGSAYMLTDNKHERWFIYWMDF